MKIIKESYTFADLLLVPKYSTVPSRADVDFSVTLKPGFTFSNPFIPANMKTVINEEIAEKIFNMKGLAILHRFDSFYSDQLSILKSLEKKYSAEIYKYVGISVGVKEIDRELVKKALSQGVKIICIDIAHGHSLLCTEMCKFIKAAAEEFGSEILLIAGNVATQEGVRALKFAGADVAKIGIGPSGICSTRIETGNGVPQMSALMDRSEFSWENLPIISDGGITNVGDIGKALCFAHMVMMGNMFAGCDESPGENIEINGENYKRYDGSSTHKEDRVEGVKALVKAKGPIDNVFKKMIEGLQSCCGYQGVKNLVDLRKDPTFIKLTNAGIVESGIHDVKIVKE